MKINLDSNNLNEEKLSINLSKNKRGKSNIFLTNGGMRTSKDISDINENGINISNARYITYSASNEASINKRIKGKAITNITLNNEECEHSYENVTSYTNQNLKPIKQKNLGQLSNNVSNIYSIQNIKNKKKVKFNTNFIDVIEIESYKRYNINNYLSNRTNCVNCSCQII